MSSFRGGISYAPIQAVRRSRTTYQNRPRNGSRNGTRANSDASEGYKPSGLVVGKDGSTTAPFVQLFARYSARACLRLLRPTNCCHWLRFGIHIDSMYGE